MSVTQKRKSFTMSDKLDLIRMAEEQERTTGLLNKTQLAFDFGISKSTVREILQNREKILEAIEDGADSKRKRVYPAKHPTIERSLVTWTKQMRGRNDPVTGSLLKVC